MISKTDADRIKDDAVTAIDALRAIAEECRRGYVSAVYLKEKISVAVACTRFIQEVVHDTLKEEAK